MTSKNERIVKALYDQVCETPECAVVSLCVSELERRLTETVGNDAYSNAVRVYLTVEKRLNPVPIEQELEQTKTGEKP